MSAEPHEPHELLTVHEVAAMLRCSIRAVNDMRVRGIIPAEKYSPKFVRYRRVDIEKFREQSHSGKPV